MTALLAGSNSVSSMTITSLILFLALIIQDFVFLVKGVRGIFSGPAGRGRVLLFSIDFVLPDGPTFRPREK